MKILRIVIPLLFVSSNAYTQSFGPAGLDKDREGKWDVTFQILYSDSENYTGENGSTLNLKSDVGFGFGFAYNLNRNFALGFELNWLNPDYRAFIQPEDQNDPLIEVNAEADIITGQFKGTWNILDRDLTPYIDAGLGWTYADSNIIDEDYPGTCWWDPWWGYICDVNTYDDTNFSYGGALGLRWDLDRSVLLKLSYNYLRIDSGNDPELWSYKFEIGGRF